MESITLRYTAEMELHHLRYFAAIAERLSFSRAAVDLEVTQPALSRQMRDLELELGAPLFNREGRRISLTAAGEALLPAARATLVEAERGRQSVREILGARGGRLSIGSSPQTAATVLAPLLRRFQNDHPTVDLQVIEEGAQPLITLLSEGKLDLAVIPLDVPHSLSVVPFLTARILALAPVGHPIVKADAIDLRELVAMPGVPPIPLLLLKENYLTRLRLAAAWHEAGLLPHVAMESAVGQTLAAYAEAGLGVAILPETVDLRGFSLGVSVVVDQTKPLVLRNGLGWSPRRYLSPAAHAFIDLVRERAAAQDTI